LDNLDSLHGAVIVATALKTNWDDYAFEQNMVTLHKGSHLMLCTVVLVKGVRKSTGMASLLGTVISYLVVSVEFQPVLSLSCFLWVYRTYVSTATLRLPYAIVTSLCLNLS